MCKRLLVQNSDKLRDIVMVAKILKEPLVPADEKKLLVISLYTRTSW